MPIQSVADKAVAAVGVTNSYAVGPVASTASDRREAVFNEKQATVSSRDTGKMRWISMSAAFVALILIAGHAFNSYVLYSLYAAAPRLPDPPPTALRFQKPPSGTKPNNSAPSTPSPPVTPSASPTGKPAVDASTTSVPAKLDRKSVAELIELLKQALEKPDVAPADTAKLLAVVTGEHVFTYNQVEFRFLFVPAGRFFFGYGANERDHLVAETGSTVEFDTASPQIDIRITRGFFLLDRELTRRQFAAITTTSDAGSAATTDDDAPITTIPWQNAMDCCEQLTTAFKRADLDVLIRLPTEIEWEYAARGPWAQRFPWPLDSEFHAWAEKDRDVPLQTIKNANNRDVSWRGHYNLAGNVREWCLDLYSPELHKELAKRGSQSQLEYDPGSDALITAALSSKSAPDATERTIRGGALVDSKVKCEVPLRRRVMAAKVDPLIGFRPVLILNLPE